MKSWDAFKTAYFVAECGSISGAANKLNVHRATVLRHIDGLEAELGTKLFIRERSGYSLTEVGEDLLRVAKITHEQLNEFSMRSAGHDTELQGELIITTLEAMAPFLIETIALFQEQHPKVRVRVVSSEELIKLEYGQAHIAIRTGSKPSDANYVVQPFLTFELGLYAAPSYLEQFGRPTTVTDFAQHRFISPDAREFQADFFQWYAQHVPAKQRLIQSNSPVIQKQALENGLGISLALTHEAQSLSLERVMPEISWTIPNWIVTHGDLHRSDKVQAFLTLLKSDNVRTSNHRKLTVTA